MTLQKKKKKKKLFFKDSVKVYQPFLKPHFINAAQFSVA